MSHSVVITCTCRSPIPCRVPHGVWLVEAAEGFKRDNSRARRGFDHHDDRRPVYAPTPVGQRVGPPFEARYSGRCAHCGGEIRPGGTVRVVSDLGLMHHESECRQSENFLREL